MILTGKEIKRMRDSGSLTIEPFIEKNLNPNSYNYRLGPRLGVPDFTASDAPQFRFIDIPDDGYVIEPGTMYLGHTYEVLGSDTFAMSLIGRSSLGRLGLFLQVSANLGHTGSSHQWTLELVAVKKFRLYAGMRIGQISFWTNYGDVSPYTDGYSLHNDPTISALMSPTNQDAESLVRA